jgi:hypothetical protein
MLIQTHHADIQGLPGAKNPDPPATPQSEQVYAPKKGMLTVFIYAGSRGKSVPGNCLPNFALAASVVAQGCPGNPETVAGRRFSKKQGSASIIL